MDITPSPIAFEALRRAAGIPDLSVDDPPGRFIEAMFEHRPEFHEAIRELHSTNPRCPCGTMTMREADTQRHHCTPRFGQLQPVPLRAKEAH